MAEKEKEIEIMKVEINKLDEEAKPVEEENEK